MPKKPKNDEKTEKESPSSPSPPSTKWYQSKRVVLAAVGGLLVVGLAWVGYVYLAGDDGQAPEQSDVASFEDSYDAYQKAYNEGDAQAAFTHLEAALMVAPEEEKIALTYQVGYSAFLAGQYDKAVSYLEQYKSLTQDEDSIARANFYIEESKRLKLSQESLDLQEYEDAEEPPATSEVYEEL